jgi:hypothetical protein
MGLYFYTHFSRSFANPIGVNENEAPEGFIAVPKTKFWGHGDNYNTGGCYGDNLCNHCDWRKQCNDPKVDKLAYGHRCMSHAVIASRDGKTYQREDKQSVVFKRKEG